MMTLKISDIVAAHRSGVLSPAQTVLGCYDRRRARADPGIFIAFRYEGDAVAEAQPLGDERARGPLSGIPVAVKDNMDVAGLPTTAACPAFEYRPEQDAEVVAKLRAAG